MATIEFRTAGITAVSPEKPVTTGAEHGPVASPSARTHANAHSAVQRSELLDPGEPPVDADRVAEIRRAIERDQYPVIPTRVADAMIAAGMLLRSK